MWEHLVTLQRETGHTLEHINLGGGIPVNYLRDPAQADELPEHEREMLGANLEPADVLAAALNVARESAVAANAGALQISILPKLPAKAQRLPVRINIALLHNCLPKAYSTRPLLTRAYPEAVMILF